MKTFIIILLFSLNLHAAKLRHFVIMNGNKPSVISNTDAPSSFITELDSREDDRWIDIVNGKAVVNETKKAAAIAFDIQDKNDRRIVRNAKRNRLNALRIKLRLRRDNAGTSGQDKEMLEFLLGE